MTDTQIPTNCKVMTYDGFRPCCILGSDPTRGIFRVQVTDGSEPFPSWSHGGGMWVNTATVYKGATVC